jgi:hypothetical protein
VQHSSGTCMVLVQGTVLYEPHYGVQVPLEPYSTSTGLQRHLLVLYGTDPERSGEENN